MTTRYTVKENTTKKETSPNKPNTIVWLIQNQLI